SVDLEVGKGQSSPLVEQLNRLAGRQRSERPPSLTRYTHRLSTGRQDGGFRATFEERGAEVGTRRSEVLAIIQHQKRSPVAEPCDQPILSRPVAGDFEDRNRGTGHLARIADRRQFHPPDPL